MKLETLLKHSPFEDYTEFKILSVNGDFLTNGMMICGKSYIEPSPKDYVTENLVLQRTVREIKAINRQKLEIVLAW